jgi:hypothetical protein
MAASSAAVASGRSVARSKSKNASEDIDAVVLTKRFSTRGVAGGVGAIAGGAATAAGVSTFTIRYSRAGRYAGRPNS